MLNSGMFTAPASKVTADPSISSSYIPALDGLRAIAFLCVFVAHTTGNTISRFVPATFGVTLFFFLSGYLITTLLRNEHRKTGTISLRDFYIRRALRIFIPMYITYAVAAGVSKFVFSMPPGNTAGFWSVILYCFNYVRMLHPQAVLPIGFDVTWSLNVEEHFYILFPVLFSLLLRKRVALATQVKLLLGLCLLGLCWRTYVNYHHFPLFWTYFATDCRFDSILWGCLLAVWTNPRYDAPTPLLKRYSGVLAALAFAALVGSMFSNSWNYRETLRYTLQGICLYFIFYFAISSINHWSVRWLENKALRYIGWLSYTLYLIHSTVHGILVQYLPPKKDWLVAIVCFAISMAYAIAMRYTVEVPLQKLRARFRHTASTAVLIAN